MKFYIYTLGCKVNTYESNIMRELLWNAGYIEEEPADILIVNTCTVTNTADHKSLKMVHHVRRQNPNALLIVTGCSTQNQKEIFEKDGQADIILGNQFKSKIIDYIEEYKKTKTKKTDVQDIRHVPFEKMQLKHFKGTRAFVKIQDGCNNFCSYCIIPFVRGNVRSKKEEDVLSEVKTLVQAGKQEIVLTGIHTGNYGRDIGTNLATLLHRLSTIEGLKRIRISSIEITELDADFMEELKTGNKIVDHLHIPLQSGSDEILRKMNRKYDTEFFLEKLKEIRSIRPDISITTDVIVGFPKETEALFQETIETIKKAQFSKIHVFPYSKREGTKAASMDGQIDEKTKKKRVQILLDLSDTFAYEYMRHFVNQEVEVLPEVYKEGVLVGHTSNYLQVKCKGKKTELNKRISVYVDSISYPYLEAHIPEQEK